MELTILALWFSREVNGACNRTSEDTFAAKRAPDCESSICITTNMCSWRYVNCDTRERISCNETYGPTDCIHSNTTFDLSWISKTFSAAILLTWVCTGGAYIFEKSKGHCTKWGRLVFVPLPQVSYMFFECVVSDFIVFRCSLLTMKQNVVSLLLVSKSYLRKHTSVFKPCSLWLGIYFCLGFHNYTS